MDDLDDFSLDLSPRPPRQTPGAHSRAATPTSLLRLHMADEAEPPLHFPPPASPTLVKPPFRARSNSSHFPFPSPFAFPSPSWSPTLTLSPRALTEGNPQWEASTSDQSPEALATPPSPLGLPGTYTVWTSVSSSSQSPARGNARARRSLEYELLLPPPFLDDDTTTTRKSFEGILGWKAALQEEKLRREHEQLYALGRAPPLPFPQSLFSALRKLLYILGPPGGYDLAGCDQKQSSGKRRGKDRREAQQRRRIHRAESGLKAYEFGSKFGEEFSGKLRRRVSHRGVQGEYTGPDEPVSNAYPSTLPEECDKQEIKPSAFSTSVPDRPRLTTRVLDLVVWILVGSGADSSNESVGGVVGLLVHLAGFTFFVLSHSAFLAASSVLAFRTSAIFIYWVTLNLVGKTDLSRAIVAYYGAGRREWGRVVEEERATAITVWSALRGLAELAALHSMTRRHWLSEELVLQDESGDDSSELVSLLKRCGRLATASYGLQTVLVCSTPLLTPSGATLPHRLFAHLGGVGDHRNVLHVALQKSRSESSETETVYAPTFYILRDDARRQIIVVFRGTQSLADIETDLKGDFVPVYLPSASPDPPTTAASTSYRIHAGILAAARHLLHGEDSPLLPKLAASLEETGYDLLLTGHSLGSALASTVAILSSTYDSEACTWSTSESCGLPPRRSIRAITFAHPTTLNAPLAQRCAVGAPPLVLSVSLVSDVITRAGLPQLRELRRTLGRLDRERRDGHRIISDWWKWQGLVASVTEAKKEEFGKNVEGGDQREQTVQSLEEAAWRTRLRVERDTAESQSYREVDSATPAGRAYHLDLLPPDIEAERRRARDRARGEATDDGDRDEELLLGLYEVKDAQSFYQAPLLSSDSITSHLPKAYLDAVESL